MSGAPEMHNGHSSGVHIPRSSDASVKSGTLYCFAIRNAAWPSVSRLAKPTSSTSQSSRSVSVESKAEPALITSSTRRTRLPCKAPRRDCGTLYRTDPISETDRLAKTKPAPISAASDCATKAPPVSGPQTSSGRQAIARSARVDAQLRARRASTNNESRSSHRSP